MRKWLWFIGLVVGLVGCGEAVVAPTPTAVVPPTAIAAAVLATVTETAVPPTLTPTLPPTITPTPSLTPTSVVNFAATDTPTPTATPIPSITPTSTPVAGVGVGEAAAGELMGNGIGYHLFNGQEKVAVYLMVQAVPAVDVALAIYDFDAVAEAAVDEAGRSAEEILLASEPLLLLNQAAVGEPEMTVFRPAVSGAHTIVVGSISDTAGGYRLYLFDPQSDTVDTVAARVIGLTDDDLRSFEVTSKGALPIGVFVYPFASGDMQIVIKDGAGNVLKTADSGDHGLFETAFMQPDLATTYTVEISEKEGLPLTIGYAIVALQDNIEE